MTDWIVVYEGVLRATAFVSTFVLVAIPSLTHSQAEAA
jgi:hypothetical protein